MQTGAQLYGTILVIDVCQSTIRQIERREINIVTQLQYFVVVMIVLSSKFASS